MFGLFFLGVALQAEARAPGCTCQVPQLYFWTGEELCGAQKGTWSSSFLLWGWGLARSLPSALHGRVGAKGVLWLEWKQNVEC